LTCSFRKERKVTGNKI
jgi:hypothetical protein